MSLLRVEGFDHQLSGSADFIATMGAFQWMSGGGSFPAGRFGGRAYGMTGGFLYGSLAVPIVEAYYGIAMFIPSGQSMGIVFADSSAQVINPASGSNAGQVAFVFNAVNGRVSAYRGPAGGSSAGTLLQSSSNNVFSANAWFYAEVHVKIDPANGLVAAKVNNSFVLNATGLNTRLSPNSIFDIIAYETIPGFGGGSGVMIDDMYLEDISAGPGTNPFNTFQGPVRVVTLYPAGAGASAQWTPLASTNWSQVGESQMDSDTTYDFSSTVGQFDLHTVTQLPVGTNPLAVQLTLASRQDAAGSRQISARARSSASDFTGTARFQNQTYTYQFDVLPLDPNGSIAWTEAAVNAMQIGYVLVA